MAIHSRKGCAPVGFGLFWLLMSLVFFGVATYITITEAKIYRTLQDSGVVIAATVTDKFIEEDDGTSYYIQYEFLARDANGESFTYTRQQSVKRDSYDRAEPGGHIDVLYAPDDPATSRIASELRRPPWFLPVFSLFFVLIGMAFVVGGSRGKHPRPEPAPPVVSESNYGISQSSLALESLHCERCGLPLGPEMLTCTHRESEACAYTLTHAKLSYSGCLGAFLVIFGVIFSGIPGGFSLFTSGGFGTFQLISLLFSLPFMLAGLAITAAGIYVLLGKHTTLNNEKTGQRWQTSSFLGIQIYETRASALQAIELAGDHLPQTSYPASCASLALGASPQDMIYNSLLSLMAQDIIQMRQQITLTRSIFHRKPRPVWRFAFAADKNRSSAQGELETRLANAVETTPELSAQIPQGLRFLLGMASADKGISIREMLHSTAGGSHSNPGGWFQTDVVGPDAESRGLGTMVRRRLRTDFETAENAATMVDSSWRRVEHLRNAFQQRYPEAAADLWRAVEKGLESLEPSD